MGIDLKPASNGVGIYILNTTGMVTAEYELCGLLFFCLWGDLEIDIKDHGINFSTDIDFGAFKASNGKLLPKFTLENFDVALSSNDFVVRFKDSLNAWVQEMVVGSVIDLAEWILLPVILEGVNSAVPSIWNGLFQSLLNTYGGIIPVTDTLGFDFSYSSAPVVTTEHFQFFLNANLIDLKTGKKFIHASTPNIKIDTTSNNSIQFGLGAETINAAAELLQEAGILGLTIPHDSLPDTLSTSAIEQFLGGFVTKFGKDVPIDLKLTSWKAPEVVFTEGSFKGEVNFDMAFMIND